MGACTPGPSRVQVEERIAQFEADMKRRGDTWKMHLKKNAPGTYMLFVVCVSVCAYPCLLYTSDAADE